MNNRNPFRKTISALLALALVLSLAPVRAMAAGQEVPVCGCESDDPSWHAPFCEAYVAPEDPQCLCVEQCAEGAANEWCDVCYFDAAACAASGEEEAAVYATAPTYISQIAVSYGAKESTPKDILRNNGFTIIDYDLNKGCGSTSHYIYLGYKTTTDPSQAITGIFFRTGSNPPTSATFDGVTANLLGGSGETNPGENTAVDLNADAGGDYIYAYVTRDTSRAPLTEIVIDAYSSKSGYVTPNVNLNLGTKGGSIYLHYKQFSATVSATYHYLNASGSRTSSTQSGTVKTHLEKMSKVPSYPTSVTYEGRSYTFKGWREDDKANTASTTAPYATYMTGTKTYRAVYQGNVTVSFDANGGSGAPAAAKGSHYINAGSSSVSKQSVSVKIPNGSCTHPTKCNFLGWAAGQSATSATYQPGDSITVSGNTTLYAVYANHSYNDKGICTACSGLDHTCQYSANGFCPRCDGYQPAELGSGYYQITNGGNLFWFAKHINTVDRTANAKLIADINLEGRLWTPIGSTGETNNNFRGHFDGQGHTIKNLYVEGGRSGLGFFGEVRLGTVENFTIYGEVKLTGRHDYVGGVIGSAPGVNANEPNHNGATIRNITSYVNVTLGEGSHGASRVGGFIGYANHETLIENCAWYGTLDLDIYRAQDGVGGLLGKANDNSAVTIRNCGAYGTIRTAYKSGSYDNFDTIFIGGIVSNSVASAKTTIKNTLWAGKIVNETNLGTKAHIAAFGTLNGIDSVTDCYAWKDSAPYITTNGTQDSYITSVTTAQLASGEVAYKLGAAWGQTIGSNAYPILGGKKVYFGYADCQATVKIYANVPLAENVGVHSYDEQGFCTMCGGFQPATGSGTSESPYKIGNAGQLCWFAAVVNAGYGGVAQNAAAWAELTANITVNNNVLKEDGTLNGDGSGFLPWTPIGNGDSSSSWYTGTFNGNGKTVSGLYVNKNTGFVGLFGCSQGTVKNVGVVDSYISGSEYAGGVMGANYGTVANCYNTGNVSGGAYVGGVVGRNGGTVEDCYNTGTVSGSDNYVGGVVGTNNGTVEDCYNTGTVSGSKEYVGGVVGTNNGTVEDCYNTGTVSGSYRYVGGVVGYNSRTVKDCYNTGTVSSSDNYVGGVVGRNGGTVEDCYNTGTVSGSKDNVGGVVGFNTRTVKDCYNTGNVSSNYFVGGVVGYNYDGAVVNSYSSGSVSGSDSYVGGVAGYNSGTVVNCYYNSTVCSESAIGENTGAATDVLGKSTAEFASGAVTYSLSQGCTVGETVYSGDAWGQNLDGEGKTDAYPVFSDAKVYRAKNCKGEISGYSNTDGKQLDHTYENGFCTVCDGFQSATGDGTQDNPYKIGNAGQLYWFAAKVNGGDTDAWAELTADIVVNENVLKADGTLNGDGSNFRPWTPIGTDFDWYTGTFDGNDKTVSGLYVNENTSFVGLFGWSKGTVKNVGVVDSYISGSEYAGGVVGKNNGTVEESYNTGNVSGGAYIGGVVGKNDGTVEESYNTGSICGSDDVISVNIGGVVGFNSGSVEDCYNTGAVSGIDRVGGVVGSSEDPVANCYNTGNVSGNSTFVGGVAGSNYGPVVNCYYDSTVYSGNAIGFAYQTSTNDVEGKTTEQFKSGEVAYLLQGEQTQQVWGQNIDGEGEKDAYPVFSDAKVYPAKNCNGSDGAYSNTQDVQKDHIYSENGFCANFGCYQPATGSGTESDPYKIGNAGQLYWFASQVNYVRNTINGKLIDNIVVNEDVLNDDGTLNGDGSGFLVWTPIRSYYGTFDGDGHTISGLYSNNSGAKQVGLFGTSSGTVKNVGVVDSYISGLGYLGGVVGYNLYGTVVNCYNTGTVSGEYSFEGGSVGGVVGGNCGTIMNCYNTGNVSDFNCVGGVVGGNQSQGNILENCYNTGNISGSACVGGVMGYGVEIIATNCYNTGNVSGDSSVGGLVGESYNSSYINCYYDSTVYHGGAIGVCNGYANVTDVEGKSTADFASGHVAYLLSRGCTVGETVYSGEIWGQNIDGKGEKDAYPVFSDAKVYPAKNCDGSDGVYSNTQDVQKDHIYSDNGFCTVCDGFQSATGSGIESDPYKIGNAGQLYWFAAEVNDGHTAAWAVLTANITVNTGDVAGCNGTKAEGWKDWTPIGTDIDTQYEGTFDGKGFTVSGLYFNKSDTNYVGLFGCSGGTVKNVGVVNSYLHGNERVSGVVGYNNYGNMEDCYNTGTVIGIYEVGGVTSCNIYGTVTNCYNEGTVSGSFSYVGGVAGYNYGGTVTNCYNEGTVSISGDYVGGVAGYNYKGTVTNCYNEGSVSGSTYTGGVAGSNDYGTVTNCYNEGSVSGSIFTGGVVGPNYGPVVNSYNIGSVSGDTAFVGGVVGENYGPVVNSYNIGSVSGNSKYVGGVVGDNSGPVVNCYYDSTVYTGNAIGSDSGTATDVVGKTTEQFTSGEVAYLLSQRCTVGEGEAAVTYPGDVWGQNIDGEGEKDAYPVFSDAKVYAAKNCANEIAGYSNTDGKQLDHTYNNNGFCTVCKGYQPATGSGTENDPYKIDNAGQLYWFAAEVNDGHTAAWAELTANITVNTGDVAGCNGTKAEGWKDWTPIGKGNRYTGTFDGKGFTVSGLYFNKSDTSYVGLFGFSDGTIKNIGVVNSYLHGFDYVGGVVGENDGTVESCYNTGTVSGSDYVSGVVGDNYGTVESCYNTGTVSGSYYVGGVVGENYGTVESCYNTGTVSGSDSIGGVVGNNYSTVENCYNEGAVSGSNYIGGLVGSSYSTVANCYNEGAVSGDNQIGGLVGNNYSTVANCYNTGIVSGSDYVGGVTGRNDDVVEGCYNTGSVSGSGNHVGGVVGYNSDTTSTVESCYNTGTVSGSKYVGGVVGSNYSPVVNCYYDSTVYSGNAIGSGNGTATNVEGKTTEQFKSGEVAYLLEGEQTQQVWGQNIDGEGEKDSYPVFSDAKVYAAKNCANEIAGYSNTEGKQLDHTYENGFCTVCDGFQSATGSGIESDPYKIGNAGQLYWFAAAVNGGDPDAWAVLTANITVNTGDVAGCNGTKAEGWKDWTPIGNSSNMYTGTFDGDGHTISGLYFNNSGANEVGLFGCSKGTVKNVGVVDSYISGGFIVGGVVSYNEGGTVANCYNTGAVSGSQYVGGVVGYNSGTTSTVESCYNTGTVSGEWYVGGVVGENYKGTVVNCYNSGTVSGSYYAGGVVGTNYGTVANCYNTGSVSGSSECVGGVAGYNWGTVENCYNTGSVSGSSECVGGVVGENVSNCTVVNSYNTGSVSGSKYVGGVVGENNGTVVNCYYNSETYIGNAIGHGKVTATDVLGKTTAEFASGAVTYSLSQGCTVGGTVYSGDAWGQNIDGDDKDAYPLFSNAKVYFGYYDCLGSYTNNASVSQIKPGHSGQLTYADNGDDATHTVTCDTCGDVVDASQIHSYGEDHKCLCGAVEEVLSVTISWGSMVFVYTEEAGWNNPDSAWVKTENTGNLQISVTYTYETDRTDIAGIFSNGTNSAAGTAVILPEQAYQVWLRLEGKPSEVLENAVIGTVKVTVG